MSMAAEFQQQGRREIAAMTRDETMQHLTRQWFDRSCEHRYSYHFTWLGRPIIQYPQDIVALQELLWQVKPDLVIETGVAHGGSLVLSASVLELLGGDGLALGIDVEIRPHNRAALEAHPLARRLRLLEGSSVDEGVIARVYDIARGRQRVFVVLDSNHTHAHVAAELRAYTPLVKTGSYVVVLDTVIEDMPVTAFPERPWGRGNSPRTAVREFLETSDRFVADRELEQKLLLTTAPEGFLRCVRD
jgi:cephalosporin hydroxylase